MNPIRAPMDSQNPHSSVNRPLDLRIALPTVGASIVVSLFGCIKMAVVNSKITPLQKQYIESLIRRASIVKK